MERKNEIKKRIMSDFISQLPKSIRLSLVGTHQPLVLDMLVDSIAKVISEETNRTFKLQEKEEEQSNVLP